MKKDEKKSLFHSYIQAYNSFNISGMLKLLHNEVKFENISNNKLTAKSNGLDEFKGLAEQTLTLFSTRNQRILKIDVDREKLTASIDFEAVLAVDLSEELRAGDKLKLQGISEFTFRDNLIFSIKDIS